MRTIVCISLALALTGCGWFKDTIVSTPPARCSALIPDSWSDGVEAAPVPDTVDLGPFEQVKAWASAYVAQGGQLAKANGRTADTVHIVQRCEELINAARADAQ